MAGKRLNITSLKKNQLPHIQHLKCLICGKQYQTDEVDYVCPDHGFEGILDVVYDYDYIKQQLNSNGLRQNIEQSNLIIKIVNLQKLKIVC